MKSETSERDAARAYLGRVLVGLSAAAMFGLFAWVVGPGILKEWSQAPPTPNPASGPAGSLGWLDPAELPPQKGRVLPAIDPQELLMPQPQLITRGRVLFQQNCVSCHGDQGRGDGPASVGLAPRPRNFAGRDGWTNGYRITDLFQTLSHGVQGTAMAPFDYLFPSDRMALVHYVRALGAFDHGPEDANAVAALSAQLATSGGRVPNRIPVTLAMAKLVKEEPPPPPPELPGNAEQAAWLRQFVGDPERAALTRRRLRAKARWDEIASGLAMGAPGNGFSPGVATLNAADWQLLCTTLLEPPDAGEDG